MDLGAAATGAVGAIVGAIMTLASQMLLHRWQSRAEAKKADEREIAARTAQVKDQLAADLCTAWEWFRHLLDLTRQLLPDSRDNDVEEISARFYRALVDWAPYYLQSDLLGKDLYFDQAYTHYKGLCRRFSETLERLAAERKLLPSGHQRLHQTRLLLLELSLDIRSSYDTLTSVILHIARRSEIQIKGPARFTIPERKDN